ncbi:MAG TPA: GNAT family N-acetyltransferase [Ohtaekwangia sp.]
MLIESLATEDISQVSSIQPEGWQPITPSFQFYLQSPFCFPLKCTIDEQLVGLGATILHNQTAWLAHIIVSPAHRNKGIGTQITKALIQIAEKYYCKTILLLATTLGEPVYAKLGFKKEMDYIFLQNGKVEKQSDQVTHSYDETYRKSILKLDRMVSGEDRSKILIPHLTNARMVIHDEKIGGVYLPTLGEGLVIAENEKSGIALLTERLSDKSSVALPTENSTAIAFLITQGYSEFLRGSRMYLGEKLSWQPTKLYSRIGGNLG